MGIVNVTPDSFFDGGKHNTPEAAYEHAISLVEQGAVILDIGGESSRPGSAPVSLQEELDRVCPVVEAPTVPLIAIRPSPAHMTPVTAMCTPVWMVV